MANYRKSFNFRNGVQVDNDNFIVNANGLVGIGTSIPTESLDVIGNVKITGFTTATTLGVGETATFSGDVEVGSAINFDPVTGDVTATRFVGDASGLTNIFAISTTGWVAQGVGLHTFRSVGVGTTNPEYYVQIGLNPETGIGVGITDGNIRASGIITATSFVGNLSGNVTGNVAGDLTGVASTATKLETARNLSITGDLEASSISFDGTANVSLASTLSSSFNANTSGIITASEFVGNLTSLNAIITTGTITNAIITNADVGIGTFDDLRVNKTSSASIVVTSNTDSSLSIGASVGAGNSSAQLKYTSGVGRLDINNFDLGGVSINLHEGTGVGNTEGFSVKYDNTKKFEVTYDGKVGVNRGGASLTRNFEVDGTAYITGDSEIVGVLTVGTGSNQVSLGDGSPLPVSPQQNFNTVSGISTFNDLRLQGNLAVGVAGTVTTNFYVGGEVGIGTTNNVGFVTGNQSPILQVFGSAYSSEGFVTNQILGITTRPDGSILSDPRTIPNDLGGIVPSFSYGNFQIDSGASSLITENLSIVPTVGVTTVGFGSTNLGLISKYDHPGYSNLKYLTKVGINTFFARSIFDVGTASTTMNSYFIPPSLSQSDLNIVADLWNSPLLTGYTQSVQVTPNGIIAGGIVHNKTTNTIQVANGTNSFRNLSPVVAFATVNAGSIVSTDGYNLSLSNSTTNANFTFSTALQSANYTVMVSFGSTTESYTVPEAQKLAASFRITFSPSNASTQSYSVMILQI
jgi:hypothetical protein